MLTTKLTEALGCRVPVIQTAMGWIAKPELVAATSNAGAFGFLAAAVMRPKEMAEEIARLRESWLRPGTTPSGGDSGDLDGLLGKEGIAGIDPFDRAQLAHVVAVCRRSRTLSDAGRELFAVSRTKRTAPNDADRLRKYLARFGLDFSMIARSDSAASQA